MLEMYLGLMGSADSCLSVLVSRETSKCLVSVRCSNNRNCVPFSCCGNELEVTQAISLHFYFVVISKFSVL